METACYFCQRNLKEIDFKDKKTLERFISASAKIKPRKKTGLCSKHQRQLSKAIKRARFLGLLPFVIK
ncbi:30S ribosomal protein S18 [bacterium]|nr:30S ribosomal protein S18 [bacterium]